LKFFYKSSKLLPDLSSTRMLFRSRALFALHLASFTDLVRFFMTTSLDQLPFDLLFCIASNLELEDVVHLGQTCRQLKTMLDERTLCRRTVEVSRRRLVNVLTYKAHLTNRSTIRIQKKLDKHGRKRLRTSRPSRLSTTEGVLCQLRSLLLRAY
jgi:hypothetical protein